MKQLTFINHAMVLVLLLGGMACENDMDETLEKTASEQSATSSKPVENSRFGETRYIWPHEPIPPGWGIRSKDIHGRFQIINLAGAPFAAETWLYTRVKGQAAGWVRLRSSGSDYGYMRNVVGAPFGYEVWADPTWGVPIGFVRVKNMSVNDLFKNVAGAPFGYEVTADPSWAIPVGFARIKDLSGSLDRFKNLNNAPSGFTQWVDTSYPYPAGWLVIDTNRSRPWWKRIRKP